MRRLAALALSLLACSLVISSGLHPAPVEAAAPSYAAGQPLVMALYYPWYDESTWDSGMTADQPMIPYASWERETIERHIGWAKDAGLDALVSAWFGPRDDNPTEHNLKTLLDVAEPTSVKMAILLETDSNEFFPNRAALVEGLKTALATHVNHPAYLRVGGKPVIFVWRPSAVFSPSGARVNQKGAVAVSAWKAILDEVDPGRKATWIGEGDDFSMLDVFDGIFPYSIAWAADPASQLGSYGGKVRAYNSANGTTKRWVATAMPGYDDTHIPGRGNTFAVDRAGGAYYQQTFKGAIASAPDWVMVTSFNEWLEGHQIEPSASYGTLFLDLTRTLGDSFRKTASGRVAGS
jgi:hypothetical protein